jgi:hypothetical protein
MSVLSPKRKAATAKFCDAVELEHDPEKWKPVFPRDKRQGVCAEIMLNQRD